MLRAKEHRRHEYNLNYGPPKKSYGENGSIQLPGHTLIMISPVHFSKTLVVKEKLKSGASIFL